jgi:hypothetical protein
MRKANQPEKDQVEFKFLTEAEHDADRVLAGQRALTAAQNKSLLRGGLEGMKFPMMMWLGYIVGSQRRS